VAAGDPDGNPWGVSFMTMFHMSNDSHLFRTREQLEADGWTLVGNVFERPGPGGVERMLPLYEAKMIHHYDHRWATFLGPTDSKGEPSARDASVAERGDPGFVALGRYWVTAAECRARVPVGTDRDWSMGIRDITNSTNERTVICTLAPKAGAGNNLPLITSANETFHLLPLVLSSFALDFAARPKVGGVHLNFFIANQLPVLAPSQLSDAAFGLRGLESRLLELTYTAWDMAPFARDLGDVDESGQVNPPFVWDDERRFLLRAELDAAFFHLYGIARDDADYIMDTFPIVRRKDEAARGEYRTKRVILELYDAMQAAMDTGVPYASPITPPPGHGPRHPQREVMS
jgi:hypothetical protein